MLRSTWISIYIYIYISGWEGTARGTRARERRHGMARGRAEVTAVAGGLNVVNPDSGNVIVIASAAVEAFLPYLGDRT